MLTANVEKLQVGHEKLEQNVSGMTFCKPLLLSHFYNHELKPHLQHLFGYLCYVAFMEIILYCTVSHCHI